MTRCKGSHRVQARPVGRRPCHERRDRQSARRWRSQRSQRSRRLRHRPLNVRSNLPVLGKSLTDTAGRQRSKGKAVARPPSPPSRPATRSSTRIKPRPVGRAAASAPVAQKSQAAPVPTRTASGTHRQVASPGPVNTDLSSVPFTIPTLFPIVPHPGETVESFVGQIGRAHV